MNDDLARVYQDALDAGLGDEGARAAVAIAQTEAGYRGALGDQGQCYDAQTRVLSRRGFVHFADLTPDDELATRRDDGLIEYHRPSALQHYRYVGPMYHVLNRSLDLFVTAEHNIYAYEYNQGPASLGRRPIRSMVPIGSGTRRGIKNGEHAGRARNWRIPVHSTWLGERAWAPEDRPFDADPGVLAAFLGLYVAEGHVLAGRRDRPVTSANAVTITQTDNARIGAVRRVLGRTPLAFREHRYRHNREGWAERVQFQVHDRRLTLWLRPLGKARTKHIPRDLLMAPPDVLAALLTGLMLGDGHAGRPWYTTVSSRLAEDVAEIAIKLGYGATIGRETQRRAGWATKYRVVLKSAPQYELDLKRHLTIVPHWEGDVYCATVPNHTMLVERNGKITWCANSAGTFQFYHGGGMGDAYARDQGLSPQQSIAALRSDPHRANAWALRGYLGDAIRRGLSRGLRGAELATFAQRVGQRSVSPERAGVSYQALFGDSQTRTAGLMSVAAQGAGVDDDRQDAQTIINQLAATKGKAVSITPRNPTSKDQFGEEVPNPNPVYRYLYADGTYLDVQSPEDPATGAYQIVGGTALRDLAQTQAGAEKPPDRVTVDGNSYSWDAASRSYVPTPGIPRSAEAAAATAATKIRMIGGRPYTLETVPNYPGDLQGTTRLVPVPGAGADTVRIGRGVYRQNPDGTLTRVQDLPYEETRSPEQIAKEQQALLPAAQRAIQDHFATVKVIQGMLERGEIDPEQANAYIAASKAATEAGLRGATPFDEAKERRQAEDARRSAGLSYVNQRLSSGASLASSLISGAANARLAPGQTGFGIDLPRMLGEIQGGQEITPIATGLLTGAGTPQAGPPQGIPVPAGAVPNAPPGGFTVVDPRASGMRAGLPPQPMPAGL